MTLRKQQENLHAGESEAIALALELGLERIILDDKQARETADRLGLKVIGLRQSGLHKQNFE